MVITEEFDKTVARMSEAKPAIMKRQSELLAERYDLSDRPAKGLFMDRAKPVQEGVRVKLPERVQSWEELGALSPEAIPPRVSWPKGFCLCRIPIMPKAAWCFRKSRSTRSRNRKAAT